ncbi:MAG: peptide ABC transporter substrate-binding protein, partial [Paracoccaceae bacterium]
MQTQSLVILALSALGLSSPSFADRGGDGNVSIIYWQAPSILNPYLTGGTKDLESSSLVVEPLGRYDNTGALV